MVVLRRDAVATVDQSVLTLLPFRMLFAELRDLRTRGGTKADQSANAAGLDAGE